MNPPAPEAKPSLIGLSWTGALAEMPRVKLLSSPAAGSMISSSSSPEPRVQVPSPLSMPAESVAPLGTLETVTTRPGLPSSARIEAGKLTWTEPSSLPEAVLVTVRFGVSATGSTVTSMVCGPEVSTVEPSSEDAVTVSWKSASLCCGGVMVRPLVCAGVRVQVPSPLSVPAESVAPVGTPETSTDCVAPGSRLPRVMLSGIAVSSSPVTSAVTTVGASLTSPTVMEKVSV